MGVVAASAWYALMAPALATGQEANILTTVASLGSGTATSRINIDAIKPRPATDRGLALPSLAVTDDGSGFDSSHRKRSGHGLRNMQARAANLGASVRIESRPTDGTRVVLTFPLKHASSI